MKALKFSRQRESIRECLKNRTDHPTADAVYVTISKDYPKISLGTVYRNLNLLADMGEIQRFSSGDGSEHFDYNTDPHYHFVCRTCGAIIDMPLDLVHRCILHGAAVHIVCRDMEIGCKRNVVSV